MVLSWRSGIYHRLIMHGPVDDSGTGLSIFGTCTAKVCTFHDLGVHGFLFDNCLPVVFLGLFVSVQLQWHQRIHWGLETFWSLEYIRGSFTWITAHS
jgi:hypothetical protein